MVPVALDSGVDLLDPRRLGRITTDPRRPQNLYVISDRGLLLLLASENRAAGSLIFHRADLNARWSRILNRGQPWSGVHLADPEHLGSITDPTRLLLVLGTGAALGGGDGAGPAAGSLVFHRADLNARWSRFLNRGQPWSGVHLADPEHLGSLTDPTRPLLGTGAALGGGEGGLAASRPAPRPAPARNPPQPACPAPPPAPAQSGGGGGSIFGGIGSTIAQGMAFGTGSAMAHRAVDAVMGPRTIQDENVVSEATDTAPADSWGNHSKALQHNSAWISMKQLLERTAGLVQNWSILCPADRKMELEAFILKLRSLARSPEGLAM